KFLLASKKRVSLLIPSDVGKYILISPITIFIGLKTSFHIPGFINVGEVSCTDILLDKEYGVIG
ncbi:hypothetical protein L0P50_18445, partial [Lawsonibacter sp. DFI.6.74]|nr:hypothetical protein [Lawsonibacter sp. DFI.6.74]